MITPHQKNRAAGHHGVIKGALARGPEDMKAGVGKLLDLWPK